MCAPGREARGDQKWHLNEIYNIMKRFNRISSRYAKKKFKFILMKVMLND
jgi:hypothetical protein